MSSTQLMLDVSPPYFHSCGMSASENLRYIGMVISNLGFQNGRVFTFAHV